MQAQRAGGVCRSVDPARTRGERAAAQRSLDRAGRPAATRTKKGDTDDNEVIRAAGMKQMHTHMQVIEIVQTGGGQASKAKQCSVRPGGKV